jgi:hypothetical protein
MDILVRGARGGSVSSELVAYATLAVRSFSRQLRINRKKIIIDLRFHNRFSVDGAAGLCLAEDDRLFKVDVCLFNNWLCTLAHEMVHVKQFSLKQLDPSMTRWKSRKNVGHLSYDDQPWEKEAFRLQMQLVENFENGVDKPIV